MENDNKKYGWIKLYRCIQKNELWSDEERFDKRSAWVDLLLTADKETGELKTSERKLAKRWKWGKTTVREFINFLINKKMVAKTICGNCLKIEIKSYKEFQKNVKNGEKSPTNFPTTFPTASNVEKSTKAEEVVTTFPTTFPTTITRSITRNNILNTNKLRNTNITRNTSINNNIYTMCEKQEKHCAFGNAQSIFEELWKAYPNKKGKGQVSEKTKKKIANIGLEEMQRAIKRYLADYEKDKDWKRMQNGSTFFNSGYVDYIDSNYEEQPKSSSKAVNEFLEVIEGSKDGAQESI